MRFHGICPQYYQNRIVLIQRIEIKQASMKCSLARSWRMCVAVVVFSIFTSCLVSCQQHPAALRSGYIIEQYQSAECVSPFNDKSISPGNRTRAWDTDLEVIDKIKIQIRAFESVGGQVNIRYLPDGRDLTIVPPRDYVYPMDIRINRKHALLYAKTDGLAAGIWRETWLYVYDLRHHKLLSHVLVDPAVLPSDCSESQ
jgi:hypothetical protein